MPSFADDYERDIAAQKHSGPHLIDDERKALNRAVFTLIKDLLPIPDIHKKSDCDLIYRFLIAKKWKPEDAAKGLREYVAFRIENRLDEILWETVPAEMSEVLACDYSGFDTEGHPIFCDKPDPKGLGLLLDKFTKEELMRAHLRMMEIGRRLCKEYQTDRVSCILDLSLLNMAVVTNPKAMGFIKAMAHVDQTQYPENVRRMFICNGGWTFSALYKVLKPLLDPRVQEKINFIAGGAKLTSDLEKFVKTEYIPLALGGKSKGVPLTNWQQLRSLPVKTPPSIGQSVVSEEDLEYGSPHASSYPVPDDVDPDDL
ncbi:Hypothetical protein, putative [Bodo saltans]|uniref:CRAL-TRIO domain-containing protein n=1 Tax=Bodo saltans TaxID=75058 RepID=A0A0S4JUH6_BODSA|nr:Hypothetical protein, putative [Bodo saltans]|eukprot:CUG94063.1 Hypothetical protein, putative [Bodo saltans]